MEFIPSHESFILKSNIEILHSNLLIFTTLQTKISWLLFVANGVLCTTWRNAETQK